MTMDTGNQPQADGDISPVEDDLQSSTDDGNRVGQLETELADYKQRLGNAVRVHGEESKQLQTEYTTWAAGMKQYYDELAASKDQTIGTLEDKLIELSDSDGAKAVLEGQRARQEEEQAKREAREAAESAKRQEVTSAMESATRAFPQVTVDDLKDSVNAEAVWKRASELNTEKQEQVLTATMEERMAELTQKMEAKFGITAADAEVEEQEQASRTPGSSSQPVVAPAGRGVKEDPRSARLNELREALVQAKKTHQLQSAVGIKGDIIALETELRTEGLL